MTPSNTLCWNCKHAVRRVSDSVQCPWAWSFKPVPGWVVDSTVVHKGECYKSSLQSYIVKQCPLFEKG